DIVRFVATFNNTIHSGNGHDLFMLDGSSAGNILIAGYGNDTFNMQNSNNRAYGMDGDDTFIIDEIVSDIQAGNVTGFGIDGGHSNLRFLNPGSDGRGDTLKLLNGTDVNFSLIRSYGNDISYIERIDTDNGGQANDITLS